MANDSFRQAGGLKGFRLANISIHMSSMGMLHIPRDVLLGRGGPYKDREEVTRLAGHLESLVIGVVACIALES